MSYQTFSVGPEVLCGTTAWRFTDIRQPDPVVEEISTFRVKGEPYVMPNNSIRVDVALDYKGRSWGTIQVDLSPREGDPTQVEIVEPLGLEPFGLDTPDTLPCLALRYHVAQKIHAMTEPPRDEDTPNERFRDLADLLLMRELTTDVGGLRAACVDVFAIRGTHAWPPVLDPPAFWQEPFAKLAEEVELSAGSRGPRGTDVHRGDRGSRIVIRRAVVSCAPLGRSVTHPVRQDSRSTEKVA